ncbi:hypothetical protein SB748_35825, partial [Rhizobium sp. SIMBA_035]
MALVPGGVLGLDPKAAQLHLYQQQEKGWVAQATLPLAGLKEPENTALRASDKGLQVLLRDDEDGRLYQGQLNWQATPVALP